MDKDNSTNDYAAKFLADMEAKYAALGNAIAGVRAALNIGALGGLGFAVEGVVTPATGGVTGTPVALPRGAFNGKNAKEAILIYLGAMQTRKANKEIAQALKDGGLVSSGNLEAYITNSLFRLKEEGALLRFDDGWGLAEWSPPSLRARAVEKKGSEKRKSKKKKYGRKAKGTETQGGTKPKPTGLQQRVDTFLRSQPTRVFPAQEIAEALDVNLGALNLTLGKMLAAGKVQKWAGGYQAPEDNIQQMPKAV